MDKINDDALIAAVRLVANTGANEFEIGYLNENMPIKQASWWAKAQYRGARIFIENQEGPVEAAEALAERLLTGAKCQWCEGLVTLNSEGVTVYPGIVMVDGTLMPDNPAELAAMGQCLWRRIDQRWEPGCIHGHSTSPGAPKGRAAIRRLAREYKASR